MAIIYGNSQILYACLLILWETCFRWLLLISWGRLFVTYNAVFFFLKSNFLITELKIDWADQTLRSWSSYQIIELHDPFLIQTITPYSLVLLKRCFNHPCPVFFFFIFFSLYFITIDWFRISWSDFSAVQTLIQQTKNLGNNMLNCLSSHKYPYLPFQSYSKHDLLQELIFLIKQLPIHFTYFESIACQISQG